MELFDRRFNRGRTFNRGVLNHLAYNFSNSDKKVAFTCFSRLSHTRRPRVTVLFFGMRPRVTVLLFGILLRRSLTSNVLSARHLLDGQQSPSYIHVSPGECLTSSFCPISYTMQLMCRTLHRLALHPLLQEWETCFGTHFESILHHVSCLSERKLHMVVHTGCRST